MGIDVISLVVFGFCIALFIWDKLPMATTAILGCAVMVIFGVCDFKTAFGQFASSTVILTIGVMVIGAAISETGLAVAIGNWIVKISKGSEIKLIIGTYIVSAIMSAFLTNSAVLAVFIPIIIGLASTNSSIKAKNLIMPISIACVLGGTLTLVGSTQQMTAQGLMEDAGIRLFKTFDFLPVASVVVGLGLIYCLTFGRKVGQKIWMNRVDSEQDFDIPKPSTEYVKWKMIVMACIFAATVVFYITEWIPITASSISVSSVA